MTPDERFLIAIYKAAKAKGDLKAFIAYKKIATAIGLKETAVKNIIKHLAQANFVKKIDDNVIQLMPRGQSLVEQILNE